MGEERIGDDPPDDSGIVADAINAGSAGNGDDELKRAFSGIGKPNPTNDVGHGGASNESGITDTGNTFNGIRIGSVAGTDAGNSDGNTGTGYAPFGFRKDGEPAKKRGRKPGSGTGTKSAGSAKSAKGPSSVKGLEKILFSVHAIVAVKAKIPELILDNQEAALMANAINDVQEFYGWEVSPETTIWVNLVTALGTIYGPRIVAISSRRSRQKRENRGSETASEVKSSATQSNQAAQEKPFVMPPMPGMHAPL